MTRQRAPKGGRQRDQLHRDHDREHTQKGQRQAIGSQRTRLHARDRDANHCRRYYADRNLREGIDPRRAAEQQQHDRKYSGPNNRKPFPRNTKSLFGLM